MIKLTKSQKKLMTEFYSYLPHKVIYGKKERNELWKEAKARQPLNFEEIGSKCPALAHQIKKSYESGTNIQSAVFSECVYAQTLANMMHLDVFVNCLEDSTYIPDDVSKLLKLYNLFPRYVYSNSNKSRMLVQAGACKGIDSALITVIDLNIYTIDFKEPGAKTREPDLPRYGEDGKLVINDEFLNNYPQFMQMLEEKQDLNFFEKMGSNENNFSTESVEVAVANNYIKQYADVVCTEDVNGYLVMLPSEQLALWAKIVGEIRPAGRNHYDVWTPKALLRFIKEKGGVVKNSIVTIDKSKLGLRKERGSNGKISGYKINSLFFVYVRDCIESKNLVSFNIGSVQQLNPTIAGKMFFNTLKYMKVKRYYFGVLGTIR